jgi:hypothetical protein
MTNGRDTRSTQLEDQIDRTLRLIGSAEPRPGIEKRIAARLAHEPKTVRFLRLPRLAVASAAGLVASVAIIAGSVNHSRHMLPIAPGLPVSGAASSGIGAASTAKVAPKPIEPPAGGHARSMRGAAHKAGRATISPDAQRPEGVAVPKSPVP